MHQFNYWNESTYRTWAGKRAICVAEVVNRSLKADCTDYTFYVSPRWFWDMSANSVLSYVDKVLI